MRVVFPLIFVVGTKLIYAYSLVADLTCENFTKKV